MFSRVFVAALLALPAIVSAIPTEPHGQCNVGEVHCCIHTEQMPASTAAVAGGLLGIPLDLDALLGFSCNPISVIGLGGNNCAAQPVCCQQNFFTGLVNALNCSPINVNL